MRNLRTLGVAVALVLGCAGLAMGTVGCGSAEGALQIGTPPPPPPPPPPPAPPADKDNDGVPDADDKCPDQAGPATNNGCPVDDDPDKDGVKGDADKCPDKAGPGTADGCPPPPKVQVVGNKVEIREKIMFEEGKADIKPESNKLIEDIANVLKEHPEIDLVEVAGHADIDGTDAVNKPLTQKRAKAVMDALTKLGVDAKRMRAEGYSFHCPIGGDPGKTEEEKGKNRRVEIVILKKGGQPTDVKWGGCEAAQKKGWKIKDLPKDAGPAKKDEKAATPPKSEKAATPATPAQPAKK